MDIRGLDIVQPITLLFPIPTFPGTLWRLLLCVAHWGSSCVCLLLVLSLYIFGPMFLWVQNTKQISHNAYYKPSRDSKVVPTDWENGFILHASCRHSQDKIFFVGDTFWKEVFYFSWCSLPETLPTMAVGNSVFESLLVVSTRSEKMRNTDPTFKKCLLWNADN